MAEYSQVKLGKLKLKGDKKKKKKKRKLETDDGEAANISKIPEDDDAHLHGGWWVMKSFDHLQAGNVALQLYNNCYLMAVDNGTLTLGEKHEDDSDDGPEDAEVFMLIRISDTKIALKTGYGKYVSVNARGELLARSEAVGPQEQIDVVMEEEKSALQGHNGYFITVMDRELKALSSTASEKEMIKLRTNASRSKKKKSNEEGEEQVKSVRQCEINYVKQFQSFQDHKMRLHQGPKSSLQKARSAGKLHEAMLDRREKMKADRYCK